MPSAVLIDDDLLLDVLSGTAIQEVGATVVTTGCWYYRLARALHSSEVTGRLSRSLSSLEPVRQAQVLDALDDLPSGIHILSWRVLVPTMRKIEPSLRLNLLATEALATAAILDASIRVRTNAPNLEHACAQYGIDYGVVE